ncbi:hypothetical protein QAD02_024011 [Eretmocerus hayati]|uniref:Uncharacterized protein n=1 Tax=Eretmocerus hayati TaxID=131215 RepID=A0ACC2PZ67_9HYME|nr:hypothetical protein QAD02_024011 [Eretmocerus hayati]
MSSVLLDRMLEAVETESVATFRYLYRMHWKSKKIRSLMTDRAVADSLNERDRVGRTCLYLALQRIDDLCVIVNELLDSGASPSIADDEGVTSLMLASSSPYVTTHIMQKCVSKTPRDEIDKADETGWTSLHHAACRGNPESVRSLLAAGASPHTTTKYDRTPLTTATFVDPRTAPKAEGIRRRIAEQLIEAGANIDAVDSDGNTSLHIACYLNSLELVDLLVLRKASLTAEDKHGYNALFCATSDASVNVVRRLVDAGADVNYINEKGFPGDKSSGPITALHIAVKKKKLDVLKYLLECGADPNITNTKSRSVLTLAMASDSSDRKTMLKLLLSHGADMYNGGLGETRSPFGVLVSEGRLAEMRLFLENGFDLAKCNPRSAEDFSPLHEVIALNNGTAMLNLLLRYSVSQASLDLEHKNKDGHSPLCEALRRKSLGCVRLLLQSGASVNEVDPEGRNPLEQVLARNQSDLEPATIQLLVKAGSKVSKVLGELVPGAADGDAVVSGGNDLPDRIELAKRIVKLRVLYESLGPVTDPIKNDEYMSRCAELRSYCEACEAETVLLKDSSIFEHVTLYHVLAEKEKFFQHIKDVRLFEAFDEIIVKSKFPHYAEEICRRFKRLKDIHEIWEDLEL